MTEKLPFMRIMVTGASGFVGGSLVSALAGKMRPDSQLFGGSPSAGHTSSNEALDLLSSASVDRAVAAARPDLVIHLAAQASVGSAAEQAAATWHVNTAGTLRLAEAIASHADPRCLVLFASSAEVYGRAFIAGVVDEQTCPQPASVYAQSKLAAEQILASVLPPDMRLIIARPANHIGPGQDGRFVVPAFARQIVAIERGVAEPVLRVGNLESERDFSGVGDVIAAYLALLGQADLPSRATFNIASGRLRTIRSVLDDLLALSPVSPQIIVDPAKARASEIARTEISAAHIRSATGWCPCDDWRGLLNEILSSERGTTPARGR